MDIRKIKKLIEMLEESALTEIEISEGEESIRLSRLSTPPDTGSRGSITSVTNSADNENGSSPPEPVPEIIDEFPGAIPVVSPMVGTFYAAASPETPPFVEINNEVAVGDTLCVIEAMKIFNHVETDSAGTVRKILKNSGDPVEFGEVLFLIEPQAEEHDV